MAACRPTGISGRRPLPATSIHPSIDRKNEITLAPGLTNAHSPGKGDFRLDRGRPGHHRPSVLVMDGRGACCLAERVLGQARVRAQRRIHHIHMRGRARPMGLSMSLSLALVGRRWRLARGGISRARSGHALAQVIVVRCPSASARRGDSGRHRLAAGCSRYRCRGDGAVGLLAGRNPNQSASYRGVRYSGRVWFSKSKF